MPWEGEELTQAAHKTFDSRASAVTSRQHSVLVSFVLQFTDNEQI